MMSALRDWKVLVILGLTVLLVLKLLPPQISPSIGGLSLNPPGGGTPTNAQSKPGGQPNPTASPAVVDPQRLKEGLHPFLILRAGTVKWGAPVVVAGGGFSPNVEMSVTLQGDGGSAPLGLGTVRADKDGNLPDASLPLPETIAPGAYRVIATPTLGGDSVEASLLVEPNQPWGKLTSETAKPGGAVGFEGAGFVPGERVSMYFDNLGTPPLATVQASDRGDVSGVLRIPIAQEASHTVLFYGEQSGMPVVADLSVLGFYPWVELDNYSPGPEQSVGFAGMDFAPGEKVYVFLNSLESGPVAAVRAGADGTFKAPGALALAPGVQGTHTLIFVGAESQLNVRAEFTVQPYAGSLELTAYAGPPGSEVAFIGNGFARGEEVKAYMGKPGDGKLIATFTADDKGTFRGAGSFRVPRDARAGELTLSVVGQVSGVRSSVAFSVLPINPWAEVKQDQSGRIVVAGHGFAPGEEVEMVVGKSGSALPVTATADRNGNAQFPPQEVSREGAEPVSILLKGKESGGEAEAEHYGGSSPETGGEPTPQEHSGLEFEPESPPPTAEPQNP